MQENLSDLSARYREELLRLYGKRADPPAPETGLPAAPVPQPEPPAVPPEPQAPEIVLPIPEELPEELPEETAPEGIPEEPPETVPEEQPAPPLDDPANTSMGRLIVRSVTGASAFPVPRAYVQVFTEYGGNQHLRWTLFTDESGQTPAVEIPAPPAELSQSPGNVQPFGEANVKISADGFFTVRADKVPIFAGITSVQTFQMIPLPLHMPENAETLQYTHDRQEV